MKLEFRLLIVDDNPDSMNQAIGILSDHLERSGFSLRRTTAVDFSKGGMRELTKQAGKDFDLVMVDYNLGGGDANGADITHTLRRRMPYTDMVFYSSDPGHNLFDELAKRKLTGVFIAGRDDLDGALVGLADTVIGKAIDLNHMRGIAMAEVAEMDTLMEETLEKFFGSADESIAAKAGETLAGLVKGAQEGLARIEQIAAEGLILEVVADSRLLSSAQKYFAIRRAAKCLATKPAGALEILGTYEADIIGNRNTLAHAKADTDEQGVTTLRSIRRDSPPVVIDENWMVEFRRKLHAQRGALTTVCNALDGRVVALGLKQPQQA